MIKNESAENYLETILILSERRPVVRSVDIATELDFKKSSVSVAMKSSARVTTSSYRRKDISHLLRKVKKLQNASMNVIRSFPHG